MFSFVCATCGERHDGAPSLAFRAPEYYLDVPESERPARTFLDDDFCVVDNEHFFIRTCLEIPIHGLEETFLWGVWASLSEMNFHRYKKTFDSPEQQGKYFGWFCSRLPCYPSTQGIKTWVHVQPGGARPLLELEESCHPLCVDFAQGISVDRAKELYEASLHAV